MMVNQYDQSRLLLVLQVDHSRVAGFLAAHRGNEAFAKPQPYASVVLAAQEHDIGWWEWEMKPSTLNDVAVPVTPGVKPVTLNIDTVSETRAVLDPYPFDTDPLDTDPLKLSFAGRLVANRAYKSSEEFLEEFYRAETTTVTYTLAST